MERYADTDRDSGVSHYEISETSISVRFKGSLKTYRYSYAKAGKHHVDRMKQLARAGDGLNEYINDHVKKSCD